MKKTLLVILFLIAQTGFACHCLTFSEAKKQALKENKFVMLHFSKFYIFDDNESMLRSNFPTEAKEILNNFIYVCVPINGNKNVYKDYQITKYPQLLIVDANGREFYRLDYDKLEDCLDALIDFTLPDSFLGTQLCHYSEKQNYNTALRVAQKYLDYSMLVDSKFRQNVYKVSQSYISDAERLLKRKDSDYAEKLQKIQLLKLFHWAYEKQFDILDEKLAEAEKQEIYQSNLGAFFFLKYIASKALNKSDFSNIEAQTNKIEGFDYFVKKSEIILSKRG